MPKNRMIDLLERVLYYIPENCEVCDAKHTCQNTRYDDCGCGKLELYDDTYDLLEYLKNKQRRKSSKKKI